jgi:F-type H+-transporting ATPase subunit beta
VKSHYQVARNVQAVLQKYKELQDIIAILAHGRTLGRRQVEPLPGPEEIQRFLSQPFFVAEVFRASRAGTLP